MEKTPSRQRVAAAILELARARGPGRTLCPSEVARGLAADWRPLMPVVRDVAGALQAEGRVRVTQAGVAVDPRDARGPVRIGIAERQR